MKSDRTALVLYGTETGTAQDLALELSRTLTRLHFSVDIVGLDDAPYTALHEYTISVFVVATTGQGDFPDNARKFWTSLLRKKLGPETLRGVQYALVGLGDTSYLKFNWAARKLGKRLNQLGAEQVLEACEADEQGDEGIEGFFLEWAKGFKTRLLELWPLPDGTSAIPEDVAIPDRWSLCRAAEQENGFMGHERQANGTRKQPSTQMANSFPAVLEVNDRATPSTHWQDVRFMRLRAKARCEYLPGDALAIMPANMPDDVDTLIKLMEWEDVADAPLKLISNAMPANRPSLGKAPLTLDEMEHPTLRDLLTKQLDINAIPRRSFFANIAKYTSDEMHKERLLEFTDPQYLDEYFDYATRPRRGIIEVLQEFDSVQIPWQQCINVFPTLRPRQFSIASAYADSSEGDTVFELLIAIVKYKTVIKRIRQGVCTRYLAKLPVGTELQVALRTEGRVANRKDIATKAHVLIGAGTGIAPLRALVHEKVAQPSRSSSTVLVFGARNKDADYFFADEWAKFSDQSSGFKLITAFSRDQQSKIYVQDRIREHAETLARLMRDENTIVVVCGASGQMPKAVRQALTDVLASQSLDGLTQEDAEAYVSNMEKTGRLKQETWS